MKKSITKMMFMVSLILLCSINLLSQEGLGKYIIVTFTELNCEMNEEIAEFILDYSQYQLCLAFWLRDISSTYCQLAFLVFNTTTIEVNGLSEILQNDFRVSGVVHHDEYSRPRELSIKLSDGTNESDFLKSYTEYGLYGSVPADVPYSNIGARSYLFNDTLIYPGSIASMLQVDNRVDFVCLTMCWQQGIIYYRLEETVTDEIRIEFQNDYPYIEFVENGVATFDFLDYNEFFVLDQFSRDERVYSTYLSGFGWPLFLSLCTHLIIPTTEIDTTTKMVNNTKIVNIYPNPFNPSTTIIYDMLRSENVKLQVYNIKGQLIQTLVDRVHEVGNHSVVWYGMDNNNRSVSSGVYFLNLETDTTKETKKILLMK